MSRYIATRAIRGANALVSEAEHMLDKALAEKGPDTPVSFPNTAYYLPLILGMTGQEVEKLGQLKPILEQARSLLHPMPSAQKWTPYLGETLDSGMATLLAAETIEAIRFVYGMQPEPMPGFQLTGGTAYPSLDGNGNGAGGHLNGPIDDIQLRSWGIQLVDGRMPGFAAIVGAAKSNEVAVKIVRELQRRNILCFLSGNVNGRSIIHQLMEEGVELGYDTYTVPFGTDTISAIYALGFAARSALTFGGMKGGQAREILMYNKARVFAFVLALGEVDDLKYAAAAGAINFGFPVIADTVIPEILPTGITTYEHVVSMPFNEIDGADDLERAERLVQKCIEVRGVKIKLADVPVPVPYGSAFEGEVVRKADMRVEFGGKYSRCFEYLQMADLDSIVDGKIDIVGPGFEDVEPQGAMDLGIVVEVAGRQMQKDFEPVLERQFHYFVNGASGIQHIGQRDITWIRISNAAADKGFDLEHFGKILHARFHADFGAIVDKVQVTLYTDPQLHEQWLAKAREAYDYRNQRLADMTDDSVDLFYSCTLCVPEGEQIVFADGSFMPVEQLIETQVEDKDLSVLTFDSTGLTVQPVGEVFVNPAPQKLVRIQLANGNTLTLTANHKVLSDKAESMDWVPAGKVSVGDYLVTGNQTDLNPDAGAGDKLVIDYLPDSLKISDDEFYLDMKEALLGKYDSMAEAARELGINDYQLDGAFRPGSHRCLTIGETKRVVAAAGQNWGDVKHRIRGFKPDCRLLDPRLDETLMYLAGLVASDGCVHWLINRNSARIDFGNTEPVLTKHFTEIYSHFFGIAPRTREWTAPPDAPIRGTRPFHVSSAYSPVLAQLLVGLGIGRPGEKGWRGEVISTLPASLIAAFLRGLFDGDGDVSAPDKSGLRAAYTTCNRREAQHIYLLLKKLGIDSTISNRSNPRPVYRVRTRGKLAFDQFRKVVGSNHPDKKARMTVETTFDAAGRKYDLVPLKCQRLLQDLMEQYLGDIPMSHHAVNHKTIEAWIAGRRRPSKRALRRFLGGVRKFVDTSNPAYQELEAWSQSDISFERVKSISTIDANAEKVYNFSVNTTHNYLVNGVVVKNCQSFAPNHVCIISPQRLGLCGAYNFLDGAASYSINPTGPNQPIKLGSVIDPVKGYWSGTNDYAKVGSHGVVEELAMYSIMENPMTACLTRDAEALIDGKVVTIGDWVDAHHEQQGPFSSHILTFDDNGKITPSQILGVHRNPAPPLLVEVETKSGQTITLTPNHPVAVDRPEGQLWVRADEIDVDDRIYAVKHLRVPEHVPATIDLLPETWRVADPDLIALAWDELEARYGSKAAAKHALLDLPDVRSSWSIALYSKVCELLGWTWEQVKPEIQQVAPPHGNSPQQLPDISVNLLYLLGFLASDGSLLRVGKTQAQVFFTNTEGSLLDHIDDVYHRVFPDRSLSRRLHNCDGRIGDRVIYAKKDCWQLYGNNVVLGALADALGVRCVGEPVWDLKRLANLPEPHIASFLAGFFDGDGSIRVREENGWITGEAYLCHSDEQAARHLVLLLKRMGIVSRIRKGSIFKVTLHGADLRRFASLIQSHHPVRSERLGKILSEVAGTQKSLSEVLPHAAGHALVAADTAGTLSETTRYYYASGRSRPIQSNIERVIDAQPDTAQALECWLGRDDFLDTVTRVEMIENGGRYDDVYNLSLLDINSYIANGLLVKNCGCFECIVMLIPETNGVMVVSREDTSMTPAGMTFSTLAGMAGGGMQTPGVMGIGKYYLISPKFISADGGFKRVVWMSSVLKQSMAEEFKVVAEREGDPELLEKIADERNATTVEELLAWLEAHNHPALVMDPMF